MDDLNALERQVADEIFRIVGPARHVDDAAVVETATAPSPGWRFPSLFGATKFVVAGAIVALFGGFLLLGVLTTRDGDELTPIGASPTTESTTPRLEDRTTYPVDSATRYRLPEQIPDGLRSGTLDTPLGTARWVHLDGTRRDLPEEITADLTLGDGYVVAEGDRGWIWRSPDLLSWKRARLPVTSPGTKAWIGIEQVEDTYWLMAYPPLELWRSTDTKKWKPVDLGLSSSTDHDGFEAGFSSSSDVHLLVTDQPSSLWRSVDGTDWQELDLAVLTDRLPETVPTRWVEPARSLWRSPDGSEYQELDLDDPSTEVPSEVAARWVDPQIETVTSGDTTIMTLRYPLDVDPASLPLPPLADGWDRIRRLTPSGDVYEAWWSGGYANVRVKETKDQLRIIDESTGAELTLPDIGVGVGERWPRRVAKSPVATFFAIVGDDGLIPIDLPDVEPVATTGFRTIVRTKTGFEAYVADDVGTITVLGSVDGSTWTEVRRLGDDPGEPVGVAGIRSVGGHLDAYDYDEGSGWSSTDGVTWAPYTDPSDGGRLPIHRVGSGWLWLTRDRVSYLPDGQDEWLSVDTSEEAGLCDVCGGGTPISPSTVVTSRIGGGEDGEIDRDHVIITFDELE